MHRLVRLISDLHGSGRRHFVTLLDEQLKATHQAVQLLDTTSIRQISWDDASTEIGIIEHRGDNARAQLVVRLSQSLVTPVDREDLFRISRSIDDVLDNIRDFVRECALFEPQDLQYFPPVIEKIGAAVVLLQQAVQALLANPAQISQRSLAAKKAGNQIRRCYDEQLATLFDGALTVEIFKVRELLRRLDVIGLRLGEAADALADAAIKRSET